MARDILAKLRDSLLLRASVATVIAIVLLGVASGALPLTCIAHLAACPTNPPVDQATAQVTGKPPATPAKAPDKASPKVASKTMPPVAKPTLTHNDVVADTFAMLTVELSPPPEDTELKTRKVTTVAIGPDGQPVVAAAPVAAKPKPQPAAVAMVPLEAIADAEPASEQAPVATETPVVAETAPPADEAVDAAPAEPVASSGKATIKGSGANVHVSAGKKSDVLFALDPGEKVTISADSHGWLKVTDDQGRTGWVWEELLTRN